MKRKKPQKTTLCSMVIHDTVGGHIQVDRKDLKLVLTDKHGVCLYYASEDGDLFLPVTELADIDMSRVLLNELRR